MAKIVMAKTKEAKIKNFIPMSLRMRLKKLLET